MVAPQSDDNMMQDMAIRDEGMIQTDKLQGLCASLAPPVADLEDQELQAWHQCTAAQLLVRVLSAMICWVQPSGSCS